jgi:hypothetical protein
MRIFRRLVERKIEDVLGEDQFKFIKRKESRVGIGMLRIIPEGSLEVDEELCACFIDSQKALGHMKWTKLMYILILTGMGWWERRLIKKLYMNKG